MVNRTKCYLQPILNLYPNIFKTELSKVKFEIYVGDVHYYRTRPFENLLFLKTPYDSKLTKATRDIKWYHDEYPYDLTSEYVLVLRIPEEYHKSYEHFMKGEYSKMYSKRQLSELKIPSIINGNISDVYCVLTRNKMALNSYKVAVKNAYDVSIVTEDPEEYDIPPRLRREFLNAIGNEDFVKSICPLRNL